MSNRIERITLIERRTETEVSHLIARIDSEGNLLLEGYDAGRLVKDWWGDDDYEYWLTVPKDYKDTVLLWLVKERFGSSSEFREWLNEKGVPSDFDSWV